MQTLTIGQLAKQAGLGLETLRFYEREGLIPDPPRRASGYREYPPDTVARVKFIKRAKELGFSLKEIAELLTLRVDPETTCADVRKRAETKVSDVRDKIRTLRRIERALGKLRCLSEGQDQPGARCNGIRGCGFRRRPSYRHRHRGLRPRLSRSAFRRRSMAPGSSSPERLV